MTSSAFVLDGIVREQQEPALVLKYQGCAAFDHTFFMRSQSRAIHRSMAWSLRSRGWRSGTCAVMPRRFNQSNLVRRVENLLNGFCPPVAKQVRVGLLRYAKIEADVVVVAEYIEGTEKAWSRCLHT
jgi:hypothetical protein